MRVFVMMIISRFNVDAVESTQRRTTTAVARAGFPLGVLLLVFGLSLVQATFANADPLDWPNWRGPGFDGVSYETGLVDDWDPKGGDGSNVLWVRDDLGSRSTPIAMNGKLYILCRANQDTPAIEGERVVCVDAKTGKDVWQKKFNVYLSDVPDTRVGWSSCVGDPTTGRVYALGVCGTFHCLDGATGKTIWEIPLHEKFGLLSTYGGRTNIPVICDDLVIISAVIIGWGDMAKPAHRFIAFDKNSGDVVWFNGTAIGPYDTTYSSPTVTVLDGKKALVFGSGDGAVWAFQPRTGVPLWQYKLSRRGLNVSPLVVGNRVITGHSEENTEGTLMGAVVAIDGTDSGDVSDSAELWRHPEIMAGKSSPIAIGNKVYVIDDRAKMYVFDIESGEPVGRKTALGTVMRSSPLYADGKIYTVTANGRWYILRPDENRGVRTIKKGRLLQGDESHGSPICSHGRIYVPTTGRLYCLEDTTQQHAASERPASAVESKGDTKPAHLQIVPAELLVRPGQRQQLTARLFNANGHLLREVKAKFKVDGAGTINSSGVFEASSNGSHGPAIISAEYDGVAGTARARVVPDLPWEFDFEDTPMAGPMGQPPITWVGARYRHVVREVDGSKAMVKITTIPKGTRSRCWFGHSNLTDYTIQADVKGAITNGKMPDIGLIAQGYALDLKGADQQLQARSWVTQLRMAQSIEYSWKPNTWYRLKLQVETKDGKAYVKGKAWPRGSSEPSAWTVQAIDRSPCLSGSPGLFGNAKDAEIYLDNITVTKN